MCKLLSYYRYDDFLLQQLTRYNSLDLFINSFLGQIPSIWASIPLTLRQRTLDEWWTNLRQLLQQNIVDRWIITAMCVCCVHCNCFRKKIWQVVLQSRWWISNPKNKRSLLNMQKSREALATLTRLATRGSGIVPIVNMFWHLNIYHHNVTVRLVLEKLKYCLMGMAIQVSTNLVLFLLVMCSPSSSCSLNFGYDWSQ